MLADDFTYESPTCLSRLQTHQIGLYASKSRAWKRYFAVKYYCSDNKNAGFEVECYKVNASLWAAGRVVLLKRRCSNIALRVPELSSSIPGITMCVKVIQIVKVERFKQIEIKSIERWWRSRSRYLNFLVVGIKLKHLKGRGSVKKVYRK